LRDGHYSNAAELQNRNAHKDNQIAIRIVANCTLFNTAYQKKKSF